VHHETLDRPESPPSEAVLPKRSPPADEPTPATDEAPASEDTVETPASESTQTPDRPWRRAFASGLSAWAAAAVAYFLINSMVWLMRSESGPRVSGMLEVWNRWDTGHYLSIALKGYNPENESAAFFPLYPLLIRYLEPLLPGGALSAALIISHAACLAALTVLFRLVEELQGSSTARRTVTYLMAYPFAFFLVTAYNESVFLLFCVAGFYCMRQGYWVSAGLWGSLASGTRQAGILLALAFVIEYLRQRGWHPKRIRLDALAVLIVPLGMAAYAWYCWRAFGDWLKFVHIQALWGRIPTVPWEGTERAIGHIRSASVDGAVFQPLIVLNVIDIAAVAITLALLVLAVVGPWRLGMGSLYLTVTSFASLMMALIVPLGLDVPLHSVPRFVLEMVPAFMVAARMGKNPHVDRFFVMPAIAVQALLLLGFFYDFWLA
jgi:Gpi18-like mannosyltransferase